MKLKKTLALLLTAALSVGMLAACGSKDKDTDDKSNTGTPSGTTTGTTGGDTSGGSDNSSTEPKKVTLKVWSAQEDQVSIDGKSEYGSGLLQYLCEQFNALHPEWDITFDYGVVSEASCQEELNKDPAAAADVFHFPSDQIAGLYEAGLLYPLTVGADQIRSENGEASISAATFDGLLYGVPFTPNSWFMYYDKSKFTEEEVKSMDTMLAKDLGDGVYNVSFDLDNGWYNAAFFFANGCTLFGADGLDPTDCTFNSAAGIQVGEYMIDLANHENFLMQTNDNIALSYMKEGKLGAMFSGTWDANSVKEALGDNYGAVMLPTVNIGGSDKQLSAFADFKYIGVNANTAEPEAAQALAAYLGSAEGQKARFDARGIAPTNTELMTDPVISNDVAVVALGESSAVATLQSTISQMDKFWSPMEALGAGIYGKEITKDNIKEKLDDCVANILATLQ